MALIEIHVHIHGVDNAEALEELREFMSENFTEIQAQLTRISDATTNIANDIRSLLDKIGTGMSADEVTQVKEQLTAAADALEATANEVQ